MSLALRNVFWNHYSAQWNDGNVTLNLISPFEHSSISKLPLKQKVSKCDISDKTSNQTRLVS